jgi:type I restriction enzyme S subunit
MSGKFQSYSEYKDSGVEWFGEIPSHWDCIKLKYVADLEGEKIEPGSAHKYVGMENVESWSGKYIQKEDAKPEGLSTSFSEGDVLFGKLRPYLAKSWLADFSGICSSEFLVLRSLKVSPKFLNYYSLTEEFIKQVDSSTYGSKMPRASWDFISLMGVPVPAHPDSEKIANFLDHETAKIDTLIEKQQQLIKLLKEKRQAVISHAVTKGLNPEAPMRDSGVEWLGEVPEHWVPTRLKYMKSSESNAFVDGPFGSNLKSEHFVDDGDAYVIESNFATTGIIDVSKLKKVSRNHFEIIKRSSTKGGDIIIAKIGARYGCSSILPELDKDAVVSGNSLKLTVNRELLNVEYANELLRVLKENDAMDDGVNVTAQPALSLGGLNNLPFLLVPIEEQDEIVIHVNSLKEKFNGLISNADRFIALAKERRTALISAAVTGKIDVRNWQAPEPSSKTLDSRLRGNDDEKEVAA